MLYFYNTTAKLQIRNYLTKKLILNILIIFIIQKQAYLIEITDITDITEILY